MPDRSRLARRVSLGLATSLPLWALLGWLAPASLDGVDAANFALALRDFDPGLEQPHPPGYPLYIFLCRPFASLGASDALALALPGILAAPLLVWAVARCALAAGLGPSIALGAALWTGLHPLLLCEGPRPAPDLLGAVGAWTCLALALERRPLAAGAVFGLALGVRPDLAPFGSLLLALGARERLRFAAGLAGGFALWALPFACAAAPAWGRAYLDFAQQHFSVWGSSALSGAGDPAAALRALGLLASGPLGAGLAWLGLRHTRWPRALAWSCGAYALWVALGQNLAHARHWLPLAPALALLASAGVGSRVRPGARAAAVALTAALALPVVAASQRARVDGAALVERALAACAGCDAVYAGASARLFAHYAPPGFPAFRRADLAGIRLDLHAWGLERARVIATDEIAGVAERGTRVGSIGAIGLYRIDPAALR